MRLDLRVGPASLAERAGVVARLREAIDPPAGVSAYPAGLATVGAAALVRRRCTGCSLDLTAADLGSIAKASPDEVLRCEECNRILVRTAESGI